jgi:hypothetical protein
MILSKRETELLKIALQRGKREGNGDLNDLIGKVLKEMPDDVRIKLNVVTVGI